MAKRLTDTEKWKDDWYISLSNDDKIVWQWLLDNCSHAGLCKKGISMLNLMCRVNYNEQQLLEKMDGRVVCIKNYWFIPKFIKFQYTTLLSAKPVIVSVVRDLFSIGCVKMVGEMFGNDYTIIQESFDNHCQMIKDKDKDKDKYKDRKEGVGGKQKIRGVKFSEDGKEVVFPDGSSQELGGGQILEANRGNLSPNGLLKGFAAY